MQIWRKLNKPDLVTLCNSAPLNHTQCYDKIKFDKVLQAINVNCPQSASNNERGDAYLCARFQQRNGVAGRFKGEVGEDACAECGARTLLLMEPLTAPLDMSSCRSNWNYKL